MFEPVPNQVDFVKQEHEVLDFWERTDAFRKLQEKNRGHAKFSFIDGPITANNPMGVHHAWGRTYKDVFQRYRAMRGYDQRWQNGFDCQGLWVEVEVEKEHGLQDQAGHRSTMAWPTLSTCASSACSNTPPCRPSSRIRLGYWMDWNDPDMLRELEGQDGRGSRPRSSPSRAPRARSPTRVEQIVGRLGLPELGGSYFTFSNENNYMIWTCPEKVPRAGLDLQGHRRHALVRPLRHRHQPARDRHRGLPGADPRQRLPALPAAGAPRRVACWSGRPRPGR